MSTTSTRIYHNAADVFIPCCKIAYNFKPLKTKWINATLKKLTKRKYELHMQMLTALSREELKEDIDLQKSQRAIPNNKI